MHFADEKSEFWSAKATDRFSEMKKADVVRREMIIVISWLHDYCCYFC